MRYLLLLIYFLCLGEPASAQNRFFKIVKDYFRVDPFAGSFSAFVEAVKTDPELAVTEIVAKTDSSLFSVQGHYRSFNPFSIRTSKVEVLLAEKKRVIRTLQPRLDTIVLYQITGFFDSTKQTVKALQKEYRRINNRIRRDLPVQGETSLSKIKGIRDGAITNHAMRTSLAAPVSVGWYVTDDGRLALLLVLRLKYANNRALASGLVTDYYYFSNRLLEIN
ncbi:hypothetical protein [Niabella aurantiaca]|uniref:hypothetical protein n=1 Tax=Niabella aurantiaca TaxID=379900 RepID=UPI000378A3E1|nr:hypothetical protein [Niabella aurantiaca]